MGLSSSQARLLTLTARMHQIEYKAAKLEAMKLQMANESAKVYDEYLDALEATKVQVKTLNGDGSASYKDIGSYADFISAGYAIQFNGVTYDANTQAVYEVTKADGSKVDAYKKDDKYYTDAACTTEVVPKTGTTPTVKTAGTEYADLKAALGITAEPANFEEFITNLINSGVVTIIAKNKDGVFADETSVAINTGLQEVSDETLLRKAEAKYEADMRKIDAKDRKYDTDLAAIETERNAIKSEMETLKTVAKDNVERTFKLFS